jgi:hypothetical protein
MSGWRVRRAVSDTAQIIITFAANAANSIPYSKILLLEAFAALLVVVAVPTLFRADTPSVAANSTLKCYDSAGNYKPCAARAGAFLSRFNGQATGAHQPASWTTTAFYQQDWATITVDQPANLKTSAPAARRSSTLRKRPALTICGRRLIPCFFSALRRGVTHIASVAAIEAGARPGRELKERYRPNDL